MGMGISSGITTKKPQTLANKKKSDQMNNIQSVIDWMKNKNSFDLCGRISRYINICAPLMDNKDELAMITNSEIDRIIEKESLVEVEIRDLLKVTAEHLPVTNLADVVQNIKNPISENDRFGDRLDDLKVSLNSVLEKETLIEKANLIGENISQINVEINGFRQFLDIQSTITEEKNKKIVDSSTSLFSVYEKELLSKYT